METEIGTVQRISWCEKNVSFVKERSICFQILGLYHPLTTGIFSTLWLTQGIPKPMFLGLMCDVSIIICMLNHVVVSNQSLLHFACKHNSMLSVLLKFHC